MKQLSNSRHTSSFRDPSGYIKVEDGELYRHINPVYFHVYNKLKQEGLFTKLFNTGLLIPHEEVSVTPDAVVLKPEKVAFISYPYEWSFGQYKHAALHTLKLQKYFLKNGYSLKDATAFNIAFHKGQPVFIDTLSIDVYEDGTPWRAYKQFIMHFLGPLVLASYFGNDMLKQIIQYIDGVPVEKIAALLPFRAKLNPVIYTNIFLTAKYEKKHSGDKHTGTGKLSELPKESQIKLIDGLYNFIKDLKLQEKTEWDSYYSVTNYDDLAFNEKKSLVKQWCAEINAHKIIDHGGNDGTFSREVSDGAKLVLTADIDANAVNSNYQKVLQNKEQNIYPLVSDMMNPAPAIGFANTERQSLNERIKSGRFDVSLALALIHHISLTGNVPFDMSAAYFSELTPYLIIEFPDREDTWVSFLLESKREFKQHFDYYSKTNFEAEYSQYFSIEQTKQIAGTHRTLYLLKRR